MHPPIAPALDGTVSGHPVSGKRACYPENTVLSILIMILVAAGVLAGVDRAYRDTSTTIARWDFAALDLAQGPWSFPGTEQAKTLAGVSYVMQGTGPGPTLTMDFDADSVGRVRSTMAVTRVADGQPVRYVAEWYWASPEDVAAAAGAWPFSTERGAAFFQPDRHFSEVREVRIRKNTLWKGKIAKAFVGIKVPAGETGPFRVEVQSIEFLE
jgi:hypothetical protein